MERLDNCEEAILEILEVTGNALHDLEVNVDLNWTESAAWIIAQGKRIDSVMVIEDMGEVEKKIDSLRRFKKLLEILRSNVMSWSYTDLDSIEKVIEIIGERGMEKNISHEFVKDLSLWIERKKCQGAFEGLRWDEFDW